MVFLKGGLLDKTKISLKENRNHGCSQLVHNDLRGDIHGRPCVEAYSNDPQGERNPFSYYTSRTTHGSILDNLMGMGFGAHLWNPLGVSYSEISRSLETTKTHGVVTTHSVKIRGPLCCLWFVVGRQCWSIIAEFLGGGGASLGWGWWPSNRNERLRCSFIGTIMGPLTSVSRFIMSYP